MTNRDLILSKVKYNQPKSDVTRLDVAPVVCFDVLEKFKEVLVSIGGRVIEISSENEIKSQLQNVLPESVKRIIEENDLSEDSTPHSYQSVDVAILRAQFGVAENGGLWITDDAMPDRVLPFICSHLVIVVNAASIVPTVYHAYEKIGSANYEFGTFIAGPSKTADIEQSLVLGAHGAKTMTCLLVR